MTSSFRDSALLFIEGETGGGSADLQMKGKLITLSLTKTLVTAYLTHNRLTKLYVHVPYLRAITSYLGSGGGGGRSELCDPFSLLNLTLLISTSNAREELAGILPETPCDP